MTSPRLRARRTAELLAGRRDVEVRDLDDLAEIRAGSFEAGPVAAFQEWVLATPPEHPRPGRRERAGAARRYLAAARLIRADPAAVIVAVTHNLPMRMLVNAAGRRRPADRPAAARAPRNPLRPDRDRAGRGDREPRGLG